MLDDIARLYGTPVFVYDLDVASRQVDRLRAALPTDSLLYYSLKANPNPAVVATMMASGCRAEVSSISEVHLALGAGGDPSEFLMTGPALAASEIRTAIELGVRRFSVESEMILARLRAEAEKCNVAVHYLLRVNTPGLGRGRFRMAGRATQFGTDLDTILENPRLTETTAHCRLSGLHFYSLSNSESVDDLVITAKANLDAAVSICAAHDLQLRELDLGGGFAAPYGRSESAPSYDSLKPHLEQLLQQAFPNGACPKVMFESGRYLTAECGTLIATIQDVKISGGRQFIVLDVGVNNLGGMGAIGKTLPVEFDVHATASHPATGEKSTVVGPLCTPVDVLSRSAEIPSASPDTVVRVHAVGAYGLTASLLGFISRPIAAEVAVREGVVVSASRLELRRVVVEPARTGVEP